MNEIELKEVSFSYSNQSIFKNLNAKFKIGEKIALHGDNGTGKTTLLKIISTLLKPVSGKVVYVHPTYETDKTLLRKNMGVAFDDTHLLRNFTVMENLLLYQKLYSQDHDPEKIHEWLEKFKLQLYRETTVGHLSQGEQKKVSLIKAFLHDPAVIILDEPTNSLDRESKITLSVILDEIKGRILMVSTHDQEWSKQWTNREISIRNGELA